MKNREEMFMSKDIFFIHKCYTDTDGLDYPTSDFRHWDNLNEIFKRVGLVASFDNMQLVSACYAHSREGLSDGYFPFIADNYYTDDKSFQVSKSINAFIDMIIDNVYGIGDFDTTIDKEYSYRTVIFRVESSDSFSLHVVSHMYGTGKLLDCCVSISKTSIKDVTIISTEETNREAKVSDSIFPKGKVLTTTIDKPNSKITKSVVGICNVLVDIINQFNKKHKYPNTKVSEVVLYLDSGVIHPKLGRIGYTVGYNSFRSIIDDSIIWSRERRRGKLLDDVSDSKLIEAAKGRQAAYFLGEDGVVSMFSGIRLVWCLPYQPRI